MEIEIIDRIGCSDDWLKLAVETALEKLSDEEVAAIIKIVIAPGKGSSYILNFVVKKT